MRKNRLYRVAVAFSPSIATHRAMARGVSRFAAARGDWLLSVVHTRPDALQSFPKLTAANFDGAIGDFTLPPFNTLITERPDLPLIVTDPDLIDKNARRTLRTAGSLMCNNKSIATAAAECLLARGAASYAYINMLRPCYWSASRERTFIAAIRATGKKCKVYRSPEGITSREDTAALITFLRALPKPAAALVACDSRAQEVLAACRVARLTVPDDIAILSVDNDEAVCLHTTPTLSSIEQNSERGAYHAASVLDKAMRGGVNLLKERIFYGFSNIAERLSTAAHLPHDTLTEQISSLIASLIATPEARLTIPLLVKKLSISRRTLETHFKRATGHTLHDEIIAARLSKAKDLLTKTDSTLADIADQVGFSSASHLTDTFRRAYNTTPGAYRRATTNLT